MIIGFEQITKNLAPTFIKTCAEILGNEFSQNHVESKNAIKNIELRKLLIKNGNNVKEADLRQIIHYLRLNYRFLNEDLVRGYICATSKGYFLSFQKECKDKYKLSLHQRFTSIKEVHDSMED